MKHPVECKGFEKGGPHYGTISIHGHGKADHQEQNEEYTHQANGFHHPRQQQNRNFATQNSFNSRHSDNHHGGEDAPPPYSVHEPENKK